MKKKPKKKITINAPQFVMVWWVDYTFDFKIFEKGAPKEDSPRRDAVIQKRTREFNRRLKQAYGSPLKSRTQFSSFEEAMKTAQKLVEIKCITAVRIDAWMVIAEGNNQ